MTRLFGRGRVVLVATSADVEWNNWAKWPSYLVFVQELCQWAARPARMPDDTVAGARAAVALRRGAYQPNAVLRTPSYPADPERPVPVAPGGDHATDDRADFKTDRLGIYHLLLTSAAGQAEQVMLAVNLDPAESDLGGATEPEIRRAAPGVEFEYLSDVAVLADRPDEGQREFWRALLVAAICVLMVEQTLACWFGRSS